MTDKTPDVFPVLRYKDGPAAIRWLAGAFGLRSHLEVPGEAGAIAHAELAIGSGMVMLAGGKPGVDNAWSRVAQGVYVRVDDVDAHYARAKRAGAEIVMELAETGHGSREYSARDCDGHLWCFGTYRP